MLPLWRKPSAINWKDVTDTQVANHFCPPEGETDPTQAYAALMSQVEKAVDAAFVA